LGMGKNKDKTESQGRKTEGYPSIGLAALIYSNPEILSDQGDCRGEILTGGVKEKKRED